VSFTESLTPEAKAYFEEVCKSPFSQQAVAFLNAYWAEVGSQAPFVFEFAWDTIQYADMHSKGVSYVHLYDQGNDLDFNIGLYFYEQLCKRLTMDEYKKFTADEYKISQPEMLTAIVRKKGNPREG